MCPGQGAYLPGALRHLREVPAVAEVLAAVDAHAPDRRPGALPVGRLLTEEDAPGPEELLRADPLGFDLATYAAVVAAATVLLDLAGPRVDAVLGHSVGDLAALTVAGAVTVRQGVQLLRVRDRLLRTAGLPAAGMVATDADAGRAARLIRTCGTAQVRIAARNAPAQVVLAGPDAQLAHLERALLDGGHRVTRLASRTAFHHPLLGEVHRSFRGLLRTQPIARPALAVHTTAGHWAATPAQLRTAAAAHLTEPMALHRALRALCRAGFTTYIDSGPRALLSALVKASLPGCATAAPLRTPVGAERIRQRLAAVAPPHRPGQGAW
ncbi:acyltransferase domain-containing protein [Streptomyces sp. NPDC023723]|uniref:ACP S-malonyltransferase n=1 Tax=Streptomyces sp. NPDC023723 TaxID=3154323 RepID=UPI0033E793D8